MYYFYDRREKRVVSLQEIESSYWLHGAMGIEKAAFQGCGQNEGMSSYPRILKGQGFHQIGLRDVGNINNGKTCNVILNNNVDSLKFLSFSINI